MRQEHHAQGQDEGRHRRNEEENSTSEVSKDEERCIDGVWKKGIPKQ
jgi:hypothetical protein